MRLKYGNIDRMSDTAIDSSMPFTIEPHSMTIALRGSTTPVKLRIEPNNLSVSIEYNAVVISKGLSADNVKSLYDVERLGGAIIAAGSQVVPFSALSVQVTPNSPQP